MHDIAITIMSRPAKKVSYDHDEFHREVRKFELIYCFDDFDDSYGTYLNKLVSFFFQIIRLDMYLLDTLTMKGH